MKKNATRFGKDGCHLFSVLGKDGCHLFSVQRGNPHERIVRLWDAKTGSAIGQPIHTAFTSEFGPEVGICPINFSRKGDQFVVADEFSFAVFESDSCRKLADNSASVDRRSAPTLQSVEFSPDGTRILTVADAARFWNAKTGEPVSGKFGSGILAHALSPNGDYFAYTYEHDDAAAPLRLGVMIVITSTGMAVEILDAGSASAIAFAPNGRLLATTALAPGDGSKNEPATLVWHMPKGR